MSHQNQHASYTIDIPRSTCATMRDNIAQAHLSLNALIDLLRGNASPDLYSLAHLLSYVEAGLLKIDSQMSREIDTGDQQKRGHHA